MSKTIKIVAGVVLAGLAAWLYIANQPGPQPGPQVSPQPSPQAETILPSRGPTKGLVGAWANTGMRGMGAEGKGTDILEFTEEGGFTRRKESPAEGDAPEGRKGKYAVAGSAINFQYENGDKEGETREYAIKGRTLLLRDRSDLRNNGDPYWEYWYFVEAAPEAKTVPAKSANVLQALREKVALTGSLTMEDKSFRNYMWSGTYALWSLDLTLKTDLPFEIDLGNTLVIAQIATDGSPWGFVRVRGPNQRLKGTQSAPRPHLAYLLDDFDSTDGGRIWCISGGCAVFESKGVHPPRAGFGRVGGRSEYVFFEEVLPQRWLKKEALAGIVVALPEFAIGTPAGPERYQALVTLRKLSDAEEGGKWEVDKTEFIPLRPESLREIIASPDAGFFKKVLAVNWMALGDPENGPGELAKMLDSNAQSGLLVAGMNCLSQYGLPGFQARAAQLEYDESAPGGAQVAATEYLDKLNYARPGFESLASAPVPKKEGADSARDDDPSLKKGHLLAVRFNPPGDMVIRRVVAAIGRHGKAQLALHEDENGHPGKKVKDLSWTGHDFRGQAPASGGRAYWFVLSAETIEGWAEPYWERCPKDDKFGSYASSRDGGKKWVVAKGDFALKTTVHYAEK